MTTPYLSIIIPLHNETRRLPEAMLKIFNAVIPVPFEVIGVDNGSTDGTAEMCRFYADLYPDFYFLDIPSRGKGAAVRAGMLAARGEYLYMADVDFATPIDQVMRFAHTCENVNIDIVIGIRPERFGARSIMALTFKQVIRGIIPGIQDSQCGFKMFRRSVAQELFSMSQISGMAFDVEIFYLAQRAGYRIEQIPVPWQHDANSRVRLVGDSLNMLVDVLNIPKIHERKMKKLPA
jgi:dolichyl-phosphate beta-glucosyltransferase